MLRGGGVYNKMTLRRIFDKVTNLSIRSTMRFGWTDNQEATLEDVAHQAQSVLFCHGGHWKAAEKKLQWTEDVRRHTIGPK